MGLLDNIRRLFSNEELLTAEQRVELKEIEQQAFLDKAKELVKKRGERKALEKVK